MASMDLEEEKGDEQQQPPGKKRRIANSKQEVRNNVKGDDDVNLLKSERIDEEPKSSTDSLSHRHPLPLELKCEIYKFLTLPIQRKFIWRMGRGIYGMFRQKVLITTKRLCNPEGNNWNRSTTKARISPNGLKASAKGYHQCVFAEKGFLISGADCRRQSADNFPGTILYYYEVRLMGTSFLTSSRLSNRVGLSDGVAELYDAFSANTQGSQNLFYLITNYETGWLGRERHHFGWRQRLIGGIEEPKWKHDGDVVGCGLVLNPQDKLAIFFTLNGTLMDKQTPICPSVDRLFPTVTMWDADMFLEANFGDDPVAKPFKYDIKECPGMEFAWN